MCEVISCPKCGSWVIIMKLPSFPLIFCPNCQVLELRKEGLLTYLVLRNVDEETESFIAVWEEEH